VTARDLITRSLRLIGVLGEAEAPTAQQAIDALGYLQDLIDAWSLERLTITTVARTTFPTVASTATYTIGTGGTINVPRPVWIEHADLTLGTGTTAITVPLTVFSDQQWQARPNKALTGSQALGIFCDFTHTAASLATITVWPVPTAIQTIGLWLPTALVGPTALDTVLTYPKGYAKALRYNLGLELGPEFAVAPNPVIVELAQRSLAACKRGNTRLVELGLDPALVAPPVYNIQTDGA